MSVRACWVLLSISIVLLPEGGGKGFVSRGYVTLLLQLDLHQCLMPGGTQPLWSTPRPAKEVSVVTDLFETVSPELAISTKRGVPDDLRHLPNISYLRLPCPPTTPTLQLLSCYGSA